MTREEKLKEAVNVLEETNKWCRKHGYEDMYNYIVKEDEKQIKVKESVFKSDLCHMYYTNIKGDETNEYSIIIQF